MQRPKVGVGVVVLQDKKVLLGKRKNAHGAGAWSFAGGHLEFGESVEVCAARELLEETGLEARTLHLGPWVNDIIDGDKHYITLFAFVTQFEGTLQLLEPEKCEGWYWFHLHSLPSPLFPPVSSLIKKIGADQLQSFI